MISSNINSNSIITRELEMIILKLISTLDNLKIENLILKDNGFRNNYKIVSESIKKIVERIINSYTFNCVSDGSKKKLKLNEFAHHLGFECKYVSCCNCINKDNKIAESLKQNPLNIQNEIHNSIIEDELENDKVDLGNQELKINDFHYLAKELNVSPIDYIKEFNLESNNIGNSEIIVFADKLRHLPNLKVLNLKNNHIGYEGASFLFKNLSYNSKITDLYLNNNNIEHRGAKYLSQFLDKNKTITSLSIYNNYIGSIGCKFIANSVKLNNTLQNLSIGSNNIQDEGAYELSKSLKSNRSIEILYLIINNINTEGANYLGEMLKVNSTLKTIYLGDNHIDSNTKSNFLSIYNDRLIF